MNSMINAKGYRQIEKYKIASGVLATISTVALTFFVIMFISNTLRVIQHYVDFYSIASLLANLLETFLTVIAYALFAVFIWFINDMRRSKIVAASFIILATSSLLSVGSALILLLNFNLYGSYGLPTVVISMILCAAYVLLAIYFPKRNNGKMVRISCAIVIIAFSALKYIVPAGRYLGFLEYIYVLLYLLFPVSVLIFVLKCTGDYIPVVKVDRRTAEENGSLVSEIEAQLLYFKNLYEAGQIGFIEYEHRRRELLDKL